MRSKNYLRNVFPALALGLALIFTLPVMSGAKGDDQKHGGKKQEKHERKDERRQEKEERKSERRQERDDRGLWHQQDDSDRESRRQQRQSDWNSRYQQAQSDRESQRQQRWSDRNSRRQQEQSDHRGRWNRGDDDDDDDNGRRNRRSRGNDDHDDDDDRRGRRNRRNDRRVYSYPNAGQVDWGNIFNSGQYNTRDNRIYRNERRRESKEQRKEQRRYERQQRRYSGNYNSNQNVVYDNNNYYEQDDYGYNNQGSGWKEQLLRMVIGNVTGGNSGFNLLPQRQQNYDSPYSFRNNGGGNYNAPRQYSGIPYNDAYQQDNDAYQQDAGYNQDSGYNNASFGNGSLAGGLLNSLPVGELLEQYAGNGIASQLLGNFLAQGYDQGFLAGQYANDAGYDQQNYRDPYAFDGGVCDPYSSLLGQNRQVMSEGYEMGYRDGLEGRNDYDPQSDGNTDLVSLLLSSVLGNV